MIFPFAFVIYVVILLIMLFVAVSAVTQLWSYRVPGPRHILGIAGLSIALFVLMAFSIGTFINIPWAELNALIFDNALIL